jgi:hypothetical protein
MVAGRYCSSFRTGVITTYLGERIVAGQAAGVSEWLSGFEPQGVKRPELETGIVASYVSEERSQRTLIPGSKEFGMTNEHKRNVLGGTAVSSSAALKGSD